MDPYEYFKKKLDIHTSSKPEDDDINLSESSQKNSDQNYVDDENDFDQYE